MIRMTKKTKLVSLLVAFILTLIVISVGDDVQANLVAYGDPKLELDEHLIPAITDFIKGL